MLELKDMSEFNIKLHLFKPFVEKFEELNKKYPKEFSKLNGLSTDNLNFTSFINNLTKDNDDSLADVTIDANANAFSKDICSLDSEIGKPHKKLLSLHKIYYEISKKYDIETANRWLEEEWNGALYLHDAFSASFKPYCFAYTLEDLVNKGLFFINKFKSNAPKHLMTYTRDVLEFISWTSNRTSGACGLPDFLIYSFYFWKHDVENDYYLKNPEYYRDQGFQEIIYGINQPYLRVNQSAFTNFTIMDRFYLIEMFGDRVYPDGTLVVDYIDEILDYQLAFLEEVSKTRKETMFTFPVLTFSLLKKQEINYDRVGDFDYSVFADEDFARKCSKHNMLWADSNFFSDTDVTTLSSCCRLKNDFSKLKGFINSIGGTQLKIGSVKVNTINLARIALESNGDEDKFFDILEERVDTCVKTLDCIRHIIERNIEKGLLPNYSYKLIELSNQYNTIGINGMFEAIQHIGGIDKDAFDNHFYNDKGLDFAIRIMDKINFQKDSYDFDYSINIEAVPAERCAVVLLTKDKILFGEEKVISKNLYGNQWIPLDEKCTVSEKVRLGAILDEKCGGGQIMHVNVSGDFVSEEQAWSLLNKIVAEGVIYFAFNKLISVCEDNHGFFGDTCPVCGKPKVDEFLRIVGFLTPRSSYSKDRKEESERRYFYDLNDGLF